MKKLKAHLSNGNWGMAMHCRVLVVLSVGFLVTTSFFCIVSRVVSAGSQTQMSIGFESGWNSSWSAMDYNSASGLDYWGITTYRSHSGTHSVWCAETGNSSVNSLPNNVNHYYDQDMDAWLEIPIGNISAWDSATFTFYTWYVTGSWSLADYLMVLNSSDGTTWWVRWTQASLSSSGWEVVSFSLSTSTTAVAFRFISDPTVGLGPYEGVYIDDITVTVTDSQVPTSSAGPLPTYQTTSLFSIPFVASDQGGSGLSYVELFYRFGSSSTFALYTTDANPSGRWAASPIMFNSSAAGGDGAYEFYTRAVDAVGNVELVPANPDATTIVDTVAPSTKVEVSGECGIGSWWTSAVEIHLVSTDITSGVGLTLYRLDGGEWQTYLTDISIVREGNHTVECYSTDNAGNSETPKSVSIFIDTAGPATVCTLSCAFGANDWCVEPVTVTLTAKDNVSGVDATYYRIDGGEWIDYTEPFVVDTQGTIAIDYYSIDFAGNSEVPKTKSFRIDTTSPQVGIISPMPNSKISKDSVTIEWSGADFFSSGIDHYEIRINGGDWIFVGNATSYQLTGLEDRWYAVQVKAVDMAGNEATATVSFGIYTSIWSQNGPYHGVPLYVLIAAAAIGAAFIAFLLRKRKGGASTSTIPEK